MFKDFFEKVCAVEEGGSGDFEYREIGTAWFDDTSLGLLERLSLSYAGWRDGRRGLVEIVDGAARSSYLNALHAKSLAEIVSLAQLRHSQLCEAQDEIGRLGCLIPSSEARLEKLEEDIRLAGQDAMQTEGEDEGDGAPAFEARQRERELRQLRRSLDADHARLSSLRTRQAFLRNDAALKLTLLVERYHERAARYLRAVDGCRRQALCAGVQPPRIDDAAANIMKQALDGNPSIDDEEKEARE